MIVDGCLGSFESGFEERVGVSWEYEHDLYLHAVDTGSVGKHAALHEAFLCTGIRYRSQRVDYEFWI